MLGAGPIYVEGNILSESKSCISEVDITPRRRVVIARGWSNANIVDNANLSLQSNPAFNSSSASLFPPLTNAYVVTQVVRYCPGKFCLAHNLVYNLMG